ncbi:MAG TPA: outer membrane protein assembly factor BamD [Vicinamibacteria bacterium]|nr:outer membrane protein assembly factor BamD [Vicinamibacteria bacterium]
MRKWTLMGLAVMAFGCAHGGEPDIATLASNSDQVIWEAGQKAFERRQWESARQHFRRIIDGFPNSPFGPQARLTLADSYFKEGGTANYVLAAGSYREFLTFYPSHARSDYAQFQVGESFYKQRNGPDRDQTSTLQALDEYQKVVQYYPSSTLAPQARERVTELRQSLARAEFLAGYFYQRTREAYRAAVTRYEGILKDYPDYKQMDEVLLRLAQSLSLSGRTGEALPHLDRLLREHPNSPHAVEARQLQAQLQAAPPAPAPAVSPASTPAVSPAPTPSPSPAN